MATLGFDSVDDFSLSYLAGKGVKVVQVPFSKPSERYISILGGHADALYEQAGDVGSFLSSKQMRPLIEVFGKAPRTSGTSTSYELGFQVALPQFELVVMRAGTPAAALAEFDQVMGKVAASEEYKKFLKDQIADPKAPPAPASQSSAFLAQQLTEIEALAKPSLSAHVSRPHRPGRIALRTFPAVEEGRMTALAMKSRVSAGLPYVLLLVVSAVLWYYANHIDVAAQPASSAPISGPSSPSASWPSSA